nr:MAG TPA: hypothetical protein [Caudoviricetes sp.]
MTFKTNSNRRIFRLTCLEKSKKRLRGGQSVFDKFNQEDIVIAFFPCTRFEVQIQLAFRGELYQQKNWSDEKKLLYSMKLHKELDYLYQRLCELVIVCIRKGLKLIIENPYTQPHYLTTYWCIKPKIIDKDRTVNGDYYKKPTQFFFVNCDPKNNLVWEPIEYVEQKK